jgi:hypothetical protein
LELVLFQEDVFVLGDLVAFHEIAARHFLTGAGIDVLHANPIVGGGVYEVEANRLRLTGRRIESNRTGDERQAQVALPRWTRSTQRHFTTLPGESNTVLLTALRRTGEIKMQWQVRGSFSHG